MKLFRTISQTIICLTAFIYCKSIQAYETSTCNNEESICSPINCCQLNFALKASYLYWNVQEEYLGYGVQNVNLFTPNLTPSNATLKTHDRKWDSGFRIEAFLSDISYPIKCHFEWTYFKSTSKASVNGDPTIATIGVTTASTVFPDNPFLSATNINSTWKININEFAFDLGYPLSCSPCISFCPYLGIFGAVINQKQKIFNNNIMNDAGSAPSITVFRKNDFWGIGPRLGIGANWNFIQYFSLVCDINFAYLIGKINSKNHFQLPTLPYINSLNEKIWCGRPMTSAFVGLNCEGCICNSSSLSLSLGYEFQYWWKQWHGISSVFDDNQSAEGNWGDLTINGLVASIGISF